MGPERYFDQHTTFTFGTEQPIGKGVAQDFFPVGPVSARTKSTKH
ncbi:hypothetical protein ECP029943810_4823 [Escherichia coli P0299438.10]|nr:hypothetical protein EC2726800_5195 [Escherichia coli 2726800]ENB84285.1 hypothetical protein ECP029943810_4823 [Escherichia coli P0299438.10]END85754.1 hypothetical protein ECP02994832_5022 [Escherichia coli P0299483.2]END86564.1 hypothetical protein ECP02994833_5130 [Escherichia coli P0299483.3]ENE18863.1 hypothetical protein ECP03022933_4908 [Escherichia coli P0302293.3]ENE37412.1 hypothetical protein ECP03022938_4797 [Escherichia coli P0302293.8]ENE46391.1 hypothetical protein ECP03022